jgi:hypothetical protein
MLISKSKFNRFLDDKVLDGQKYLKLEAFSREKRSLFHIKGENLYVFKLTYDTANKNEPQNANEKELKNAKKIINRINTAGMACSMFNYQLSLTTGKNDKSEDESKTILVPEEFGSWFGIASTNRILVPDTNALMNRSFSSLGFVLGKEYLKKLMVRIPRLSILEMERMANQDHQDQEKHK